ncbi:DNA-binding transcriptional regulator, LysR family [Burkholderia sp. GAS332]|nr:DNA-binding transcriptional regulator, LysR family [Burkholderia sp. GAS332]
MSHREIEAFRAVITSGSTARASELLGLSQPAVSQAVLRLERDCGAALFDRVRGRMVPTHAARVLMTAIDRYFVGYESVEHVIRSLGSFAEGRLTIASYPALGNCFIPRAIAAFMEAHTSVQISLQVVGSRDVHQQVMSGAVDFGLMAPEMPCVGLEHSAFSSFEGVIAMRTGHPLAQRKVVQLGDLTTDNFISLNSEDVTRQTLEQHLKRQGIGLRTVVETPFCISACELARSGAGIAFVHPLPAIEFLTRGLVIRRLCVSVPFDDVLIFRSGAALHGAARQFLTTMRTQIAKEGATIEAALDA